MNHDLAIACKKDTKHAASNAGVTTTQEMGRMVFDVTLVLCSDGFKFISQKQKTRDVSFSRFMTLEMVLYFVSLNDVVGHVACHDCLMLCTLSYVYPKRVLLEQLPTRSPALSACQLLQAKF